MWTHTSHGQTACFEGTLTHPFGLSFRREHLVVNNNYYVISEHILVSSFLLHNTPSEVRPAFYIQSKMSHKAVVHLKLYTLNIRQRNAFPHQLIKIRRQTLG